MQISVRKLKFMLENSKFSLKIRNSVQKFEIQFENSNLFLAIKKESFCTYC